MGRQTPDIVPVEAKISKRRDPMPNGACRTITAAERKASELGQPMNIAVANAGGNLITEDGLSLARQYRHFDKEGVYFPGFQYCHTRNYPTEDLVPARNIEFAAPGLFNGVL
jgi:hypothetical protein